MPQSPPDPSSPPGAGATPTPWAPRGAGEGGPTTATGPGPTPAAGSWGAPPRPAPPPTAPVVRPWAPAAWPGGYPAGPPTATGGGYPPHPPGYGPVPTGSSPPPVVPPPAPDRGGRLTSALVGGIVGAVVAALVAAGLVLATDDDQATPAPTTTTANRPAGPGLDVQEILQIARPSIVAIDTGFDSAPGRGGAGTGFVIDAEEGFILTNAHVIEGADEIRITFFDGAVLEAELVGAFPADDVAMVRVEGKADLRAATLGSSAQLQVGEDVVAVGNALGIGGEPTVTAGIVSAKDRILPTERGNTLQHLLQTDAAINPGNSGGPLLNDRGEVVGINTVIIAGASNIGFALAIDAIRPLIDDLRDGDGDITPDQAFLGVSGIAVTDPTLPSEILEQYEVTSPFGVFISRVEPDSAADEAGLQEGDVITSIGGQTAENADVISEVVRSREPGDEVEITFEREGDERTVTATLTRRGG